MSTLSHNHRPESHFRQPEHDQPVRIAAVADLHVQESRPGRYRELFSKVCQEAEILLLCGDLTNMGLPAEAELLAEDIKSCRIPVAGVLGNHDYERGHADEVRKILTGAGMIFLDEHTYRLRHVGFAGVKGFGGGFDKHMLASFGEEAIKHFVAEVIQEGLVLENQLRMLNTPQRIVALHYSPIAATIAGEPPEVFPFLGCSRLAETIDRFDVAAAFHGHSHHGTVEGRTPKGATVYNCCIEVLSRQQAGPYVLLEVPASTAVAPQV